MPNTPGSSAIPTRPFAPLSRARTYLVLVLSESGRGIARPLGTLEAAGRGPARALARVLHADVPPDRLRVQAASGMSADLIARALAMDGVPMVA